MSDREEWSDEEWEAWGGTFAGHCERARAETIILRRKVIVELRKSRFGRVWLRLLGL